MKTLEDLFKFILEHKRTMVFSNLGRKPKIVFDFINTHLANVDVVIASPYYRYPNAGRISTISYEDMSEARGDLLLYVEPIPRVKVVKPAGVGRIAVLSSHLVFTNEPDFVFASYFHYSGIQESIEKIKILLSKRNGSIQSNNVNYVTVDHVRPRILGENFESVDDQSFYAIVNLNRYSSKLKMYLTFLDLFDYMMDHFDQIDGWLVVFPEKSGIRQFDQFVQDVLDRFWCIKFEHGNVTDHLKIVALLPFYTYGVVDKKFNVPKEKFCGMEYVSPNTALEFFQAATRNGLTHWVGSVYRVVE